LVLEGVKFVSSTHQPPLPPGNIPGTCFYSISNMHKPRADVEISSTLSFAWDGTPQNLVTRYASTLCDVGY